MGRGVWIGERMVGPHATCQVEIGCEGESGAYGEGCMDKRGSPKVSTSHLEYSK